MRYFAVRNFEKFQHYRDRKPPWIKLYRDLWGDVRFFRLKPDSKLLYIGLLTIASITDNRIPEDIPWLAAELRLGEGAIDLQSLVDAGLLVVEQTASVEQSRLQHVASGPLADCKQLDDGEGEGEIEREGDILCLNGASSTGVDQPLLALKIETQEAEPDKITPEDLVAGWNEICVPAGLAKVISLDAIRRKKALERIRESYKHARAYGESVEDFWGHVFTKVSKSAWCRGQRPSPGHENWRADFDFVIHDSTRPLKAREGKYV